MNVKKILTGPFLWVVLALILLWVFGNAFLNPGPQKIDTSTGIELLKDGKVEQAKLTDGEQRVELTLKKDYKDKGKLVAFNYIGPQGQAVVKAVAAADPSKGYDSEVPRTSWLSQFLFSVVPLLLIVGAGLFFITRMQGGRGGIAGFGRSKAKLVNKEAPQVTFKDVAGADEAVEELQEIKEFLAEPSKFQAVGARIPKGVLLYGPPGTGKTLLARAVAGEAGVPFYSISGSDFVEMFVGVGASRVRDLFEQAKQNSPAIVFVDEIDAVGRQRGAGLGGGNDEREQTLNQLLVEMDGFDATANVILIAATNRPDVLDPALLRPGRFDRQVQVGAPDLRGREAILTVHAKGKPMADGVDLGSVAKRTPGFTGADLANVLNEAALLTARSGNQLIDDRALDEAIDRVIAGPQRRTLMMDEAEKRMTAYHEGGHALVAASMRHTDPVTKVTILPRGRALGYTMVMPEKDKNSVSRNELLDQLAYAMGGRVSEEIVFHDPSTGASNDIENATGIARKMVMEYGMSSAIGAVHYGSSGGDVFLGRDIGHQRDYSDAIAGTIDSEVRKLVEKAHDEAWEALNRNRAVLDRLVTELLEKETLNEKELGEIFVDIVKSEERPVWLSSDSRPVSSLPPVPTASAGQTGETESSGSSDAGQTPHTSDADGETPGAGSPTAGQ